MHTSFSSSLIKTPFLHTSPKFISPLSFLEQPPHIRPLLHPPLMSSLILNPANLTLLSTQENNARCLFLFMEVGFCGTIFLPQVDSPGISSKHIKLSFPRELFDPALRWYDCPVQLHWPPPCRDKVTVVLLHLMLTGNVRVVVGTLRS